MDNFTETACGLSTGLKLESGVSTPRSSTKELCLWKAKSSLWAYFLTFKIRRFGKQTLGWPHDQALVWSSALESGHDLRLTSNQQNTAKVTRWTWYHTKDYNKPSLRKLFLDGFEEASWDVSWPTEKAIQRGAESSLWPTASKKAKTPGSLQRTECCQQPCEFGTGFFPRGLQVRTQRQVTPWLQLYGRPSRATWKS